MDNELLDARQALSLAGLVPLPLSNKRPLGLAWQEARSFPDALWNKADSLGVRTGEYPGGIQLVCIDFDKVFTDSGEDTGRAHEPMQVFTAAAEDILGGQDRLLSSTYTERSPHGYHVFFMVSDLEEVFTSEKLWEASRGVYLVETKAAKGAVRIAPSVGCQRTSGTLPPPSMVSSKDLRSILSSVYRRIEPVEPHRERIDTQASNCAGEGPAEHMRRNPGLFASYLETAGWAILGEDSRFYSLQRPGADGAADNHSIHISKDGGACTPWSSKLSSACGVPISPLNFLAAELYGGDVSAAASAWRAAYMIPIDAAPSVRVDGASFTEFSAYEEPEPILEAKETSPAALDPPAWEKVESVLDAVSFAKSYPQEVYKLPESLFGDYDNLRDIARSIYVTEGPRTSSFRFAAAWSAVGFFASRVIFGTHIRRDYTTLSPLCSLREGTAQYCAVFAPTGSGKDTGLDVLGHLGDVYTAAYNAVLARSGEDEKKTFIYSAAASAQSFESDLLRNKRALMCVDEIADFIDVSAGKNKTPWLQRLWSDLKQIRSKEASESPYRVEKSLIGRGRDKNVPLTVQNPALSAYFTGVEDGLEEVRESFSNDGTWGRFLFFFAPSGSSGAASALPGDIDALIEAIKAKGDSSGVESNNDSKDRARALARFWGTLAAKTEDNPITVHYSERAYALLFRFEKEELKDAAASIAKDFPSLGSMLQQAPLLLWKAALTFAASRCLSEEDARSLEVSDKDARAAIRLILWHVVQVYRLLGLGERWSKDKTFDVFVKTARDCYSSGGGFCCSTIRRAGVPGLSFRGVSRYISALVKEGVLVPAKRNKTTPGGGVFYDFAPGILEYLKEKDNK